MIDTLLDRTEELLYESRILYHETQQLVWALHKTVVQARQFRAHNPAAPVRPLEFAVSNPKAPE